MAIKDVPPADCRQRLMSQGKPYPKSSCSVCGKFSPKARECDGLLSEESEGLKDENDTLEHHLIDLKLANASLQSDVNKALTLLADISVWVDAWRCGNSDYESAIEGIDMRLNLPEHRKLITKFKKLNP